MTRKSAKSAPGSWLTTLKDAVAQKPIVIFRFSEDEWAALNKSRGGTNTFTIARSYSSVSNVRVPTVCILLGQEFGIGAPEVIHCGLLKSRSSNTTLERRLKIMSAGAITPSSVTQLLRLVTDKALKAIFRSRLEGKDAVNLLSPTLSVHLLDRLAQRPENEGTLRSIATAMDAPTIYLDNLSLQEDAVGLALKAFGLSGGEPAARLTTHGDRDTSLARRGIREDSVIEHDARIVPGFTLAGSELTGRAVFRKGSEVLEVITANKRPLEEALGVDLIYLNAVKQNVVMVQYKMLEATRDEEETDWLYRPDGQLRKELSRMRLFSRNHAPGPREYRINPQVFYLRFVRRDAVLGQSAVIMPVEHFEVIQRDPACQGPKGAFRISYEALEGRYLRQDGFLELIRSGYIGAYAKTTGALTALINAVLKADRAVVAAVQAALK